ncbi:MBL fold metallo-hydrolase [Myxococcota bacterium]|nr:MBL fold metallo-hydrolase [Myxococcota bacterium]MBU1431110.1 MBL fold metallo-hydrolase [Myxococcota bacterium]MBU1897106.1 MBL fold metallo-hydrolase [Myxococcota bacterium]
MQIKAFFDAPTFTLTYVVWDEATRDAVIIDPVLDLEPVSWRVSNHSVEALVGFTREHQLKVHWIIDTHAHADHLSGMDALKAALGAKTAIGERITNVQTIFSEAFNLEGFPTDGRQFDRLIKDGEVFEAGSLTIKGINTPGHTPACMSYLIQDALFTGDTMFMPDFGTGRCDFPEGSAETLYDSIVNKLYALPDETRVFVGHDYQPGGRALAYETTIGACKRENKHLKADTRMDEFVQFRSERDATLAPPKLILQSLQVNIRAGALPEPESNGRRFFKMPMNLL